MQEALIIKLLNLSVQGSIVIGVILLVRLLMNHLKVPKKFAYLLWSIAFIRLICPITFESIVSIMPDESMSVSSIVESVAKTEKGNDNIANQKSSINLISQSSVRKLDEIDRVNPLETTIHLAQVIWLIGVVLFVLNSLLTYLGLRRKLALSVKGPDNIYWSDYIETPFVLGFIKPHIYMPSYMEGADNTYILKHENLHIKRKDYIIKLCAYIVVILHWFNPIVWVAYVYMNKDMEMSCDECVIHAYNLDQHNEDIRKEYATLLLNLSVGKQHLLGAPLSFKEGDVKCRVKNIVQYKKPIIVVVVAAVATCIVLALALLSNPISTTTLQKAVPSVAQVMESEVDSIEIKMAGDVNVISTEYANQILDFMKNALVRKESKKLELPAKVDGENNNINSSIEISLNKKNSSGATYSFIVHGEYIWFMNEGYESDAYTLVKPEAVEKFIKQIYGSFIETTNNTDISVSEETSESKENDNQVDKNDEIEITVTAPTIDLSANLGADGVMLDYADNDIVIFHGYFGLFVYRLTDQQIIGAVDLEPIGCNYTQGDAYCEVLVSKDGKFVYLHPMNQSIQYTYEIATKRLIQSAYDLAGITMFDGLEDNSELAMRSDGIYSLDRVAFSNKESDEIYYGYLAVHSDFTIGDITYVVDDMVYSIFSNMEDENNMQR